MYVDRVHTVTSGILSCSASRMSAAAGGHALHMPVHGEHMMPWEWHDLHSAPPCDTNMMPNLRAKLKCRWLQPATEQPMYKKAQQRGLPSSSCGCTAACNAAACP